MVFEVPEAVAAEPLCYLSGYPYPVSNLLPHLFFAREFSLSIRVLVVSVCADAIPKASNAPTVKNIFFIVLFFLS